MAYKYDEKKQKATFEKMFGAGSFDAGMKQARDVGRLKVEAKLAKDAFLDRRDKAKKKAEEAQKEYEDNQVIYGDMPAYYSRDLQKKAKEQGRGGHQPTYENKLKERKAIAKAKEEFGLISESVAKNKAEKAKKPLVPKVKKKEKKKSGLDKFKDFITSKDVDKDGRRDGLLGGIDRFVLPISKGATEFLAPGNNERMIQNDISKDGKITNPVNKASTVDRGTETKVLQGAGTLLAALSPYSKAYKAVDYGFNKLPKIANAVKNPYAQKAIKGALAGGLAEGGLSAENELFNSKAHDMKDYAFRTGLGVAGGAILDPALYGKD